ncbi:MAG: ABC transporter permease [Candidatus Hodarchaeota archaeon]
MVLVLDVFIRGIKQTYRSPAQIFLVIGFPIGFILTFSFIFGGGASIFGGSTSYTIGVINNDVIEPSWQANFENYTVPGANTIFEEGFGEYFILSLKGESELNLTSFHFLVKEFSSISEVTSQIKSQTIILCIIIPENFSQTILGAINYKAILSEGMPIEPGLEMVNTSVELLGDSSYQAFQEVQTEISEALSRFKDHYYGIELPGGYFDLYNEDVSSFEITPVDQFIPGFIVFGILLGAASIGFIIGKERTHGTLDRLRISQIRPVEYLLGISVGQVIFLTLQIILMLLTAYFTGFKGRGNPIYAIFLGILSTIPVIGLGLLIAAMDKKGENAPGIAAVLSGPFGFLSGAFIPLPEVILIPNFIPIGTGGRRALQLWDLNPFAQLVRALNRILLHQDNLNDLVPEIMLFMIGGIPIFLIGAVLFTWRVFKD